MQAEQIKRIFINLPELHTKRLILRKISIWDAEDMYRYAHLFLTTRYLLWEPHRSLNDTRQYLAYLTDRYKKGEYYDWAVTKRSDGTMIGTCGFAVLDPENRRGEIGYVLNPDEWGNGYATEAAKAIIGFGFDQLKLHRIEAHHMVGNEASAAVMKAVGMKFEGISRQRLYVKGSFRDIAVYAILNDEFNG